jgi:DNA-binding response OmpR family regulator
MRVLIIEDDKRISDSISDCLSANGLEVKAAGDPLLGVQFAHQFRPELILLDLMMPAGGGLAFLESIRNIVYTQKTPIIVMTGSHDAALKQKLLKYGIHTYLQKPFDLPVLLAAIANVIPPPKPGS